jgi:microcystin-dependent protein
MGVSVEAFMSEVRLMSFNFAPSGWAMCNGQFMPINQNQALFSLLGTTFGGNGQTTFALPDLRGRVPAHIGQGLTLGQALGEEAHTLTQQEMPAHLHLLQGTSNAASTANPTGNRFATADNATFGSAYASGATNLVAMAPQAIGNTGGSQPHENRQPFLVLSWCICLQGIFPSRN